jgi:hypothetical protein
MGRSAPLRALWLGLLLVVSTAASAQQGEVCERKPAASRGPISLVILASGAKVRELAASVKDTPVVARDANTVIFADGRVITADVASAGEHLNALGWGSRRIDIAVSLPKRRVQPRRSYG